MIIDIHTHPPGGKTGENPEAIDKVIQVAKKFNISKMCLLGDVLRFGYNPTEEEVRKINDLTISMVKRWHSFLIGFCFLNPGHSQNFLLEEIERCIVKERFQGIKLEVAVNARDKRLDLIMEKAEEFDIPILHHSWYKTVNKAFNESNPSDIANLASRFPKVKIIMAHLSGCWVRGILDVKPFPNVYIDTSGSQPFAGVVEYAVEELGAKRILYGSDIPGRDFSAQLGRIYGAKIKEKERELILGVNAERLLKIR